MSDQSSPQSPRFHPAVYRIRVGGRLNPEWSECLQGMTISCSEDKLHPTCSELSGLLPDQSALMGVLQQLYVCGIPLLLVECQGVGPGEDDPTTVSQGEFG